MSPGGRSWVRLGQSGLHPTPHRGGGGPGSNIRSGEAWAPAAQARVPARNHSCTFASALDRILTHSLTHGLWALVCTRQHGTFVQSEVRSFSREEHKKGPLRELECRMLGIGKESSPRVDCSAQRGCKEGRGPFSWSVYTELEGG